MEEFNIIVIKNKIENLINNNYCDEAIELLKKLIETLPEDTDLYSMYTTSLYMLGRFEEAIDICKKGLEIELYNFDLNYNLACIYESIGEYSKAFSLYSISIKYCRDERLVQSIKEIIKNTFSSTKVIPCKKIIFFVKRGMDSFLKDIINELEKEFIVTKIIVDNYNQIDIGMEWADICWFEWCDELVVYGSKHKLAQEKKLICRLHSYEAFTDHPMNVEWSNINKLILISQSIKNVVIENVNINKEKISIIPNGINVDKWNFRERTNGFNISYVGYINYKKGPMLLLHTFKAIYDTDNRYKLYIAGQFQDNRDILYFNQMIKEFGIEKNVFFEGWQENLDLWLEDKNYILCTSILESQNISVMQAMTKGIKPVVHNFVGSKHIYDNNYIWNTIDEAVKIIEDTNYNSKKYREFIIKNYSFEKQIIFIKSILNDISQDKVIIKSNKQEVEFNVKSKLIEYFNIDSDDMDNTEKLFNYLLDYNYEEEYMKYIGEWFIKSRYNLTDRFKYYYYNLYRNFKNYDRFKYIKAEVYREMENLAVIISKQYNIQELKEKKNRIVLLSSGIDITQTVNKFVSEIAKNGSEEFEFFIVSILPKGEFKNYDESVKSFNDSNINYFIPKAVDVVERTVEILKYIEEVSPKYVIYQSFYFAPTSILLLESLKCMKIKIGAFILQQSEKHFHEKIDFVTSFGLIYPDIVFKNDFKNYIPIESKKIDNSLDIRNKFSIENNKYIIISIGRSIKYNNEDFWKYVCRCARQLKDVCFVFFGVNYKDYLKWIDINLLESKKIIIVGFDNNASRYIKSCNAYLNSPYSGGIAFTEAYYSGLPIITGYNRNTIMRGDIDEISETYPLRFFKDNEIYPQHGDYENLYKFTKKLVEDRKFLNEIEKAKKISEKELTYENYILGLIKFLNYIFR
jgi:glycosyltransferase involved in cell wall biosynthesis